MPTYDYRCNACSHTFEHMQSMKDKPLTKCPRCGKSALERLIGTGAAVIFKGGGFYQTDYRSESYKKAAQAESKPAASESKGESKSEPKADAKTDTKGESKGQTKSGGDVPSTTKADSPTSPPAPPSNKSGEGKGPSESSKSRASNTPPPKPKGRSKD